jgi:hypothetical protein
MAEADGRSRTLLYIVYCFILWVIVDLGTAGRFRFSYFRDHGPFLLAFYLGYPFIFAYLIVRRHWSGWKFGGLTLTLEDNGDTLLTGPVIDQAALYGLLKRVRDLGMPLLSANVVNPGQAKTQEVKS